MYLLMNKDRIIGEIAEHRGILDTTYSLAQAYDNVPYGLSDINKWIETRKASKHNARLKELMQNCGCGTTEGYIKITHGATLNDTFWIKHESEAISWDDVSLYRNRFDDVVSKLAFEGIGLYGLQLSGTSPELSTGGSFPKCWIREDDGKIFLYKRGSEARNEGIEPYCEALTSEIAALLCPHSVQYDIVTLHGKKASKCELFTNEQYGFLPYAFIPGAGSTPDNMLQFYAQLGAEDDFRRMCILDALTLNPDRHTNNHGVLFDNDTLDIVKPAPIFDFNLSLMPNETIAELQNFGRKAPLYKPNIGEDFTRTAQALLTPEIRSDLINLRDFSFSFRGDDYFTHDRVNIVEQIISRHIDAILSRQVISLANVYPDPTRETMQKIADKYKENPDVLYTSVERDHSDNLTLIIGLQLSANDIQLEFPENGKCKTIYIDGMPGTFADLERILPLQDKLKLFDVQHKIEKQFVPCKSAKTVKKER